MFARLFTSSRYSFDFARRAATVFAATTCAACGADAASSSGTDAATAADSAGETATTAKVYKPFAAANLENQVKRVGAYEALQALRKGADFSAEHFGGSCGKWSSAATSPADAKKFASLYVETASLQAKVQARKDAHSDNAGAAIGVTIDTAICGAIEAGAQAGATPRKAVNSIDWHAQVVAKGLLHFFAASLHHYTVAGTRKGYDEGIGYFGRAIDGSEDLGLAGTAKSRDDNCGTTYVQQIWGLLLKGRGLLDDALTKGGKAGMEDVLAPLTPELTANAAEIDQLVQEVLAVSLGREMKEMAAGKDPAIKLIEGRQFWLMLKPRILAFDKAKATKHATTFGQLDGNDPAAIQPQAILDAVKAVWGLDVVALCKT